MSNLFGVFFLLLIFITIFASKTLIFMEELYRISERLVGNVSSDIHRYFYNRLEWDLPMICIKGAKGIGKSTSFLQYISEHFNGNEAVYVSLDHIWFSEHRLMELVDFHYTHGGTHIFLDEVHRYPYKNWMQELKNITDSYPDLHIAFTGSSLLKIDRSVADLSRRCIFYDLQGLSFREYLKFEGVGDFPVLTLDDILANHVEIARSIAKSIRPLKHFSDYLSVGYYPYYKQHPNTYHIAIQQTVSAIIDEDIRAVANVETITVKKIKHLLLILSQMIPFSPNITKLGQVIEATRNQTVGILQLLQKAALIHNLYSAPDNMSQLTKPEKIYMENSNLMHALSSNVDKGNDRETFFANQVKECHTVNCSKSGDFIIDGKYIVEVGGKNKNFDQIKDLPDSYIASDDIEIGFGNRIPLWLFGFLY